MSVYVKICGITRPEDAAAACEAGADAIGFVFAPSKRRVDIETATRVSEAITRMERVGVFVEEPFSLVRDAVQRVPLQAVQFHRLPRDMWTTGEVDEWRELVQQTGVIVTHAFRARDADSLRADIESRIQETDRILLDAFVPNAEGGTGKTFDWSLVAVAQIYGKPVIVAGGLTPDNVGEAVRRTRAWGVDVSSGVERAPGVKDRDAIRRFVTGARG